MMPSKHVIYGLFFALLIFILSSNIGFSGFILIFLSSFLIDFDHYLIYVYRERKFNFGKAFSYFIDMHERKEKSKNCMNPLFLFHTIEFVVVLWLMSYLFEPLLYISYGFLFHMVLDFLEEYDKGISCMKDFSIVYSWLKRNKKTISLKRKSL